MQFISDSGLYLALARFCLLKIPGVVGKDVFLWCVVGYLYICLIPLYMFDTSIYV
jgi:hypothetical protein